MSAANKYSVPKRAWNKWPKRARIVFNELYAAMTDSPWAFMSPSMLSLGIQARAWKSLAWNAAWIAADAAKEAA